MALSANHYEINGSATANNVNGGGFNYANANFATDLIATSGDTSSPVVSSASYTFVAGDVGAHVWITAGTNWTPGRYRIVSVTGGAATLNAAIGAATQYSQGMFYTNTTVGCATVASPTGGTFGVDYSSLLAARETNTDLASTNGTTNPSTVTSSVTFGVNHIGNLIHITAGTNWDASTSTGRYEIVSVSGGAATLDRAVGSAASLSGGTFYLGGALSFNSTTDDDVLEIAVAGSHYWLSATGGVISLGESISVLASGAVRNSNKFLGYAATRGDSPVASTRPTINAGANSTTFSGSSHWDSGWFVIKGTATTLFQTASSSINRHIKAINTSTSADRVAYKADGGIHIGIEAVSYNGYGIQNAAGTPFFIGCYSHDSKDGFRSAGNGAPNFSKCISSHNLNDAMYISNSANSSTIVNGCTLYGFDTPTGEGVTVTGVNQHSVLIMNSNIIGFVTGITSAETRNLIDDYNNFYNNTTDVSGLVKGSGNIAINPDFVNVTNLSGTTATLSGSVLTQTGANFSSVVDGDSYVRIVSGTGATAGCYGITAHTTTTLTLDNNPGTSSAGDVVWRMVLGGNFYPNGDI